MNQNKIVPSLWFSVDGGDISNILEYYKEVFGEELDESNITADNVKKMVYIIDTAKTLGINLSVFSNGEAKEAKDKIMLLRTAKTLAMDFIEKI